MQSSDPISTVDMRFYPDVDRYRDAILQLLEAHGTPVFLAERANLEQRFRSLDESLASHWGSHVIGFSFKTNYQVAGSGILKALGAWAEVVSEREYRMARGFGYAGESIIFNGPLKPDAALVAATADGALVSVNDHDELDRLIGLTSDRPVAAEIGIRISSNLPRLGHSRFGFSMENDEAASAVAKIRASRGLRLVCLHSHLYGDTDDPGLYREAARRLGEFARDHVEDHATALKYVDLGGGYPAHTPKPKSRASWDPQPIDAYVRQICEGLQPYFPERGARPALVVEPGRYLSCDAVMLVTRVVHVKQRDNVQVVNCDGSISMVPLTHYIPQVIEAFSPRLERRGADKVHSTINGSTCRENDLLYEGPFPRVQPGDYLVHYAAGAYNANLGPDFIFESPPMQVF